MIITTKKHTPEIDDSAFVASNATIVGNVTIAQNASIWFGAVLRGDINLIKIGKYTNVQDLSVVHTPPDLIAELGDYVTVGHKALVHGAKVGDKCLIGMGAILMNGSEVGEGCIIGAGSLVTEGMKIPAGSLAFGSPAKVKKELNADEIEGVKKWAVDYFEYTKRYKR